MREIILCGWYDSQHESDYRFLADFGLQHVYSYTMIFIDIIGSNLLLKYQVIVVCGPQANSEGRPLQRVPTCIPRLYMKGTQVVVILTPLASSTRMTFNKELLLNPLSAVIIALVSVVEQPTDITHDKL